MKHIENKIYFSLKEVKSMLNEWARLLDDEGKNKDSTAIREVIPYFDIAKEKYCNNLQLNKEDFE